jgi:hypothetical protein
VLPKPIAWAFALVLISGAVCGCSAKSESPRIDPKAAAEKAMALYDSNHDGFLDAKELDSCPGLKSVLAVFDKNQDGKLSLAEIEEGLTAMQEGQISLVSVPCKITINGQPLEGANVALEPESFLGTDLKPAQGPSNVKGHVALQIEGAKHPGCYVGLYRVRISKIEDGRETIPSRYDTVTELGLGAGNGCAPRGAGVYIFSLTSP